MRAHSALDEEATRRGLMSAASAGVAGTAVIFGGAAIFRLTSAAVVRGTFPKCSSLCLP